MAKDREKYWLLSPIEILDNHRVEENSMTSLTQTVVGKDIPNLLIAEGLLKILRDMIPFDSPP